jgi:hypothetical protein
MTDTSEAFADAHGRFEASWNRENGNHPVNDSADMKNTTVALYFGKQH